MSSTDKIILALGLLIFLQTGVIVMLVAAIRSQVAQNRRLIEWLEELIGPGGP